VTRGCFRFLVESNSCTARSNDSNAYRRAQSLFRNLGSMVEGVAVVNAAERVLFSNPGLASILGLDVPPQPGALSSRSFAKLNSSRPCESAWR